MSDWPARGCDQLSVHRVEPLTGTIGAEVHDVQISGLVERGDSSMREALATWKVLVFRDQDLTPAQFLDFGRQFGDVEVHPYLPTHPDHPELVRLESTEERPYAATRWHFDATWGRPPAAIGMLRAIDVPDRGGDTLFADMTAAFTRLGGEWKSRMLGRVAIHDSALRSGAGPQAVHVERDVAPLPIFQRHPVTGAPSILVMRDLVSHIEGVATSESTEMLERLGQAIIDPSIQCRVRWHPGTVVAWDNRCTQHYGTDDHLPAQRHMERLTVAGEDPVMWLGGH